MGDPKGAALPSGWSPEPCVDVNEDPSDLNSETCVIALGDDEAMRAAVKVVAEEHYVQAGKDVGEMPLRFFYGPDGEVVEQLRDLTGISSGSKMILLDIPDDGAFYVCQQEASTAEEVRKFISDYKANKLEKHELKQ